MQQAAKNRDGARMRVGVTRPRNIAGKKPARRALNAELLLLHMSTHCAVRAPPPKLRRVLTQHSLRRARRCLVTYARDARKVYSTVQTHMNKGLVTPI